MTDKIEPALTPEEWDRERPTSLHDPDTAIQFAVGHVVLSEEWFSQRERALPALIALANAALPDSDPRKITRDMVHNIRAIVPVTAPPIVAMTIHEIADALESYLAPAK